MGKGLLDLHFSELLSCYLFLKFSLHTSLMEPSNKLKIVYVYCVSLVRNGAVRHMVRAEVQPNFVLGILFTTHISSGNFMHTEKCL